MKPWPQNYARSWRVRALEKEAQESFAMMTGMMSGMMFGMGLVWLLLIVVLILGIVALIKYLRS